jgi:5-formyltetrahydrofolate cyclo-ligase
MNIHAKENLRSAWRQKSKKITFERRRAAELNCFQSLSPICLNFEAVLSYTSLEDELPTLFLNEFLADQKKLALPRVEGPHLRFFWVDDLKRQLKKSNWGILEPDPKMCQEIDLQGKESLIFVPGIAFDASYCRLGRGKGYYDRFLPTVSKKSALGIGFLEQMVSGNLPRDPHDIILDGLYLY